MPSMSASAVWERPPWVARYSRSSSPTDNASTPAPSDGAETHSQGASACVMCTPQTSRTPDYAPRLDTIRRSASKAPLHKDLAEHRADLGGQGRVGERDPGDPGGHVHRGGQPAAARVADDHSGLPRDQLASKVVGVRAGRDSRRDQWA